jgi:hypothetical protein
VHKQRKQREGPHPSAFCPASQHRPFQSRLAPAPQHAPALLTTPLSQHWFALPFAVPLTPLGHAPAFTLHSTPRQLGLHSQMLSAETHVPWPLQLLCGVAAEGGALGRLRRGGLGGRGAPAVVDRLATGHVPACQRGACCRPVQ